MVSSSSVVFSYVSFFLLLLLLLGHNSTGAAMGNRVARIGAWADGGNLAAGRRGSELQMKSKKGSGAGRQHAPGLRIAATELRAGLSRLTGGWEATGGGRGGKDSACTSAQTRPPTGFGGEAAAAGIPKKESKGGVHKKKTREGRVDDWGVLRSGGVRGVI